MAIVSLDGRLMQNHNQLRHLAQSATVSARCQQLKIIRFEVSSSFLIRIQTMKKNVLVATGCLLALVAGTAGYSAFADNAVKEQSSMKKTINQLESIDVLVGNGKEALPGTNVKVHYTGWLYDPGKPDGHGTKFDSSVDRGEPFMFFLGGGQVIRGWDEGVVGMKVGGKRTLIIPSLMGYGSRGAGGVIPPNATLLFDVELIEVQ
jgi:FKBP-type peptidyl-prolyl cis-trans isomerase FkpA